MDPLARSWGSSTKLGLCWLLAVVLLLLTGAPAAGAANPIQAENAQAGDSYWMAATQDPVSANPPIEGYASATSVRPGATITFQVSASPAARYRVEVSRLGWYGGSGGRRITCLVGSALDPGCSEDQVGVAQPSPPAPDPVTGEVRAGWSTTDTLSVPSDWTTGYYLAVFRLTSGPSAGETGFAPFIVQAPANDHAAILVQVPTNTWQAYNPWGGEGFYTTPRAVEVSFDRPYAHRLLFDWEYPLIRFLERGGWDVSYATSDDVDADPTILLHHALDMGAGHDEYWTKGMRDGWEAARAAGVNLAFMGANDSFWQVRYVDNRRAMVGYKYSPDPNPDPTQMTTEFRHLNPARPECELFGVQYGEDVLYHRNLDLVADPAVATDPWFAGSGLVPGSVLSGLGGTETDAIVPGCHVPPVTPLLSYSGPPVTMSAPVHQDTVRYTACSGAEVFSAGTLQFSWGLDSWRDGLYIGPGLPALPPTNTGLQQVMTNALADLTRPHVPVPGPPHICVPSAGIATPVTWAAVGQRVSFVSTAADQYGQISNQRWSVSVKGRALTQSGPTITPTFRTPGTAHVSLVVADSSGAATTNAVTLPVCPCPSSSYPQAAQQGSPCQLMAIGAVRSLRHRLWFVPNASIKRFSITMYRIALHAGRIRLVRQPASSTVDSTTSVPIPTTRAPMVLDVSSRTAGRLWHQEFVLGRAPARSLEQAGLTTETLCDGTSGQILTPAFEGPHSLPLRVAVTGPGQLTVSLAGPGGTTVLRRVVIVRRKPVVILFAAKRLPRGIYHITVSAGRSKPPLAVRLTALAL